MSSVNPLNLDEIVPVPRPAAALRRVRLLLAGHTGRVGGKLLQLIAAERARLAAESHLELHVSCAVNRSLAVWHDPDSPWREEIAWRKESDWSALLRRFAAVPGPKLFVDCTASSEVAARYLECFGAGLGVVTANKIANSGSGEHYHALQAAASHARLPYRYETTAGAALPLLAPFADLRASGDRVRRVEAVLSGTLSFVFQRMNQGVAFSAAVREARDQGYAEPHPAEDLKAQDSARKLVILLREAGIALEPDQVRVQGLSPPALDGESDPERYLDGLAAYDAHWAERLEVCHRQGTRLACLARYDGREAHIGVTPVPAADAFGHLGAGENLVRVWTRRYQPVPLSIAGPGAGTEVTAGGLLTDILKAATLSRRN
jgi:bifunctional aspartokinase / homoserine dehydrogenase 1